MNDRLKTGATTSTASTSLSNQIAKGAGRQVPPELHAQESVSLMNPIQLQARLEGQLVKRDVDGATDTLNALAIKNGSEKAVEALARSIMRIPEAKAGEISKAEFVTAFFERVSADTGIAVESLRMRAAGALVRSQIGTSGLASKSAAELKAVAAAVATLLPDEGSRAGLLRVYLAQHFGKETDAANRTQHAAESKALATVFLGTGNAKGTQIVKEQATASIGSIAQTATYDYSSPDHWQRDRARIRATGRAYGLTEYSIREQEQRMENFGKERSQAETKARAQARAIVTDTNSRQSNPVDVQEQAMRGLVANKQAEGAKYPRYAAREALREEGREAIRQTSERRAAEIARADPKNSTFKQRDAAMVRNGELSGEIEVIGSRSALISRTHSGRVIADPALENARQQGINERGPLATEQQAARANAREQIRLHVHQRAAEVASGKVDAKALTQQVFALGAEGGLAKDTIMQVTIEAMLHEARSARESDRPSDATNLAVAARDVLRGTRTSLNEQRGPMKAMEAALQTEIASGKYSLEQVASLQGFSGQLRADIDQRDTLVARGEQRREAEKERIRLAHQMQCERQTALKLAREERNNRRRGHA